MRSASRFRLDTYHSVPYGLVHHFLQTLVRGSASKAPKKQLQGLGLTWMCTNMYGFGVRRDMMDLGMLFFSLITDVKVISLRSLSLEVPIHACLVPISDLATSCRLGGLCSENLQFGQRILVSRGTSSWVRHL